MRLTRDSLGWWLTCAISLITFIVMQFDQVIEAFPAVAPIWQTRLQLISGVLGMVSGFLGASPLPLSRKSKLAHRAPDPNRVVGLSLMGKVDK